MTDTFDEHDLGVLREMILRLYGKGGDIDEEERAVSFPAVSRCLYDKYRGQELRSMHVKKEGTGAPGAYLSRLKAFDVFCLEKFPHSHKDRSPFIPQDRKKGYVGCPWVTEDLGGAYLIHLAKQEKVGAFLLQPP